MLKTEKDYSDPFVRQLSLFLDNRVGKLREVLRHLTSEDIFVHALSVVDSADHAIVRLVVDRVETSHKVLLEQGVPTSINQILAVEVPNERAGIRMICRSLIQAEIMLIMHVDENDTALDLLKRDGFNCLDESDMGLAGI